MGDKNKIKILHNVPLADIKPYEKNYQKHDANLEHIKNSIKDFDFDVPIVVDVNNVIVKGHGRYEALKELGKDTVPLVVVNMALDTEKKSSAARIADNESGKAAVVDFDILNFELDLIGEEFVMGDYGLNLFGDSDMDFDDLFNKSNEDEDSSNSFKIVLEYTEEDFQKVEKRFKEIGGSREKIIYELLGLS